MTTGKPRFPLSFSRGYSCIFCAQGIEPGEVDPCAIDLTHRIDRRDAEHLPQRVFCHLRCFIARSGHSEQLFRAYEESRVRLH